MRVIDPKRIQGVSGEVVRDINRRIVLNRIRTRQPISRADVARPTKTQALAHQSGTDAFVCQPGALVKTLFQSHALFERAKSWGAPHCRISRMHRNTQRLPFVPVHRPFQPFHRVRFITHERVHQREPLHGNTRIRVFFLERTNQPQGFLPLAGCGACHRLKKLCLRKTLFQLPKYRQGQFRVAFLNVSRADHLLGSNHVRMFRGHLLRDLASLRETSLQIPRFPIMRMISPDGITEEKTLPRFDWAWSTGSKAAARPAPDCLPLDKEMTASEFLKYMVPILGVTFVREVPVDQAGFTEGFKKANEQYPQGDGAASAVGGHGAFHRAVQRQQHFQVAHGRRLGRLCARSAETPRSEHRQNLQRFEPILVHLGRCIRPALSGQRYERQSERPAQGELDLATECALTGQGL